MSIRYIFLAILTTVIWGINFIFITLALKDLPPYLLCAVRFFFTFFPAIFFLPKPKVSFNLLVVYGLLNFGLQFAFLFAGMNSGMPAGLTSLLYQSQMFFSIFLAALFLNEKPTLLQLTGAFIAFSGLVLVGLHQSGSASWNGFILVILAAAAWGGGNLFTRKMGHVNGFSLIAWGTMTSFPLMLILSYSLEGAPLIIHSLTHISWMTVVSLGFIVCISTWIGYGIWNILLREHSMATVIPFTLLVPIFAILSSHWIFNEPLEQWKLLATALIIGGLGINVIGSRLDRRPTLTEDDERTKLFTPDT